MLKLPLPSAASVSTSPTGRQRAQGAIEFALAAETRQRWRSLALIIKAKLEAIECNIATFEEEFLPYTILPGAGGRTVAETLLPQIAESYKTGHAPVLKLGMGDR